MIRQYDVVENTSKTTQGRVPYLLVLQSHLFEPLNTVIVAPIVPADVVLSDGKVLLAVELQGQAMTINLPLMANIERRSLGRQIGNLLELDYEIRRGIDRLFTGF